MQFNQIDFDCCTLIIIHTTVSVHIHWWIIKHVVGTVSQYDTEIKVNAVSTEHITINTTHTQYITHRDT